MAHEGALGRCKGSSAFRINLSRRSAPQRWILYPRRKGRCNHDNLAGWKIWSNAEVSECQRVEEGTGRTYSNDWTRRSRLFICANAPPRMPRASTLRTWSFTWADLTISLCERRQSVRHTHLLHQKAAFTSEAVGVVVGRLMVGEEVGRGDKLLRLGHA